MHKRIISIFLMVIIIMFQLNKYQVSAATPSIESGAAILMDADTGEILYSRNAETEFFPASITKVMTALLALEKGNLSDKVTMSYDAVFSIERGSSHIALDTDEVVTLDQLLHALLMVSANDAANGIAEYISGSIDNFALDMTEKAKSLGATQTVFKNPHGLHNPEHKTTALDMAYIAKGAIANADFEKLINETEIYKIMPTNKQEEIRYLAQQHKMKRPSYKYYADYIIGGKTGYTDQARHTLVTFARKNDMTLISVVLKAESQDIMYKDTYNLMEFGFNNVKKFVMNRKNQVIDRIPVYNNTTGDGKMENKLGYTDIIAKEDFVHYGDTSMNLKDIETVFSEQSGILAPIYKNDTLGNLTYMYKGTVLGTVPLVIGQTYEKMDTTMISALSEKITWAPSPFKVQYLIYYAIVLVCLLIALIIALALHHRKKKRRRY